jgi:Zn-dependent protease with chaperone function
MSGNCDIRVVRGPLIEVADEVKQFLFTLGFGVEDMPLENSAKTIQFRARNRINSSWLLLKNGALQIIVGRLNTIDAEKTQIRLSFHSTRSFQIFLYGMLVLLLSVMGGGFLIGLSIRTPNTTLAACATVVPILLTVTIGSFWIWIFTRIPISSKFFRALYGALGAEFGCRPTIIQEFSRPPEGIGVTIITLLAVLFMLIPVWREWGAHHAVVAVVSVIFLMLAILIAAIFIAGSAFTRHIQSTLIFITSVTLCCYGVLPCLVSAALAINLYGLSRQPATDAGLLGHALLTGEIILLSVAAVLVPIIHLRYMAFKLVSTMEYYRTHPETLMGFSKWQTRASAYLSLAMWLISSSVQLFCVFVTFSLAELCLTNHPVLFSCQPVYLFFQIMMNLTNYWFQYFSWPDYFGITTKAIILLYCFPIFIWVAFMLGRNLLAAGRYYENLKTQKSTLANRHLKVKCLVQGVCDFAGVAAPIIQVVESDAIEAAIQIPQIPGVRSLLVLSSGAITKLSPPQLESVLAHEIGHLKWRHTAIFSILNFLSRWTMMGEGFLAAWLRESHQLEQEADAFAVRWLERGEPNTIGRRHLIEALGVLEAQQIAQVMHLAGNNSNTLSVCDSDWLSPELRLAIAEYPKNTPFNKLKTLVKLCQVLYFQGWRATYVYLPYAKRIDFISNLSTNCKQ